MYIPKYMKKSYLLLVIAIIVIAGALWHRFGSNEITGNNNEATSTVKQGQASQTETSTEEPGNTTTGTKTQTGAIPPSGPKAVTYSNFNYNFSIKYPRSVKTEYPFTSFYHLGKDWRAGATPEYRGYPVISFVVYREDNQIVYPKKYPVYFSAEVRIGVSPDTKNCYQRDAGYPDQKITDVTFNGIAWKKFSFAQAGMMQYAQGESYRTVHGKYCYVVEQVKAGSNYRDNTMATGTPETTLNKYYLQTTDILRTFTFTK